MFATSMIQLIADLPAAIAGAAAVPGALVAAWRPLLDPLDRHEPWYALVLMVPLVAAVALVYKALKLPTLRHLGRETAQLTFYILGLMVIASLFLWVLDAIV